MYKCSFVFYLIGLGCQKVLYKYILVNMTKTKRTTAPM